MSPHQICFDNLCKVNIKLKRLYVTFSNCKYTTLDTSFPKKEYPIAEKLGAIKINATPGNIKELTQFLSLSSYYRKHYQSLCQHHSCTGIPSTKGHTIWLDRTIARSLHGVQRMPIKPPILTYPNPSKVYYLFLDTSKYFWEATLCQYAKYSNNLDDLKAKTLLSGKFSDTNCYYTGLVREAFVIYMSVKRAFTFKRLHAPSYMTINLQSSLKGKAQITVNSGSMELPFYKLNIQYIKGTKMS